jgi:hypothetical protein
MKTLETLLICMTGSVIDSFDADTLFPFLTIRQLKVKNSCVKTAHLGNACMIAREGHVSSVVNIKSDRLSDLTLDLDRKMQCMLDSLPWKSRPSLDSISENDSYSRFSRDSVHDNINNMRGKGIRSRMRLLLSFHGQDWTSQRILASQSPSVDIEMRVHAYKVPAFDIRIHEDNRQFVFCVESA